MQIAERDEQFRHGFAIREEIVVEHFEVTDGSLFDEVPDLPDQLSHRVSANAFAHEGPDAAELAVAPAAPAQLHDAVNRVLSGHARIRIEASHATVLFHIDRRVGGDQVPLQFHARTLALGPQHASLREERDARDRLGRIGPVAIDVQEVIEPVLAFPFDCDVTEALLEIAIHFVGRRRSADDDQVLASAGQVTKDYGQRMVRRKQIRVHGQARHADHVRPESVQALVQDAEPLVLIEAAVPGDLPEGFEIQIEDLHLDVPSGQGFGQPLEAGGRIGVVASIPNDFGIDRLEEKLRRLDQEQFLRGAELFAQSGRVRPQGILPPIRDEVVSHIAHRSFLLRRRWAPGTRPSCSPHRNRGMRSAARVPRRRPAGRAAVVRQ